MIVDGRKIARELLRTIKKETGSLSYVPTFAAFTIAPTGATESYLRIKARQARKAGIHMEVIALSEDISTDALIERIQDDPHDALILQLPLPASIDLMRVLSAIPPLKDADVLSPITRELGNLEHPIAAAIRTILAQEHVALRGLGTLVIGNGWLVGAPVSAWLAREGAIVSVCTRESGGVEEACRRADVIVSGAGVPGLVKASYVRPNAIVIDVGTSELGGSLAGDVAPEVAEVASVFTPVPGGVGPVAVAYLMHNVVRLAREARLQGAVKAV